MSKEKNGIVKTIGSEAAVDRITQLQGNLFSFGGKRASSTEGELGTRKQVQLEQEAPNDTSMRSVTEQPFHFDLSNVSIHADHRAGESAKSLNALAYTVGNHIVFAPG